LAKAGRFLYVVTQDLSIGFKQESIDWLQPK